MGNASHPMLEPPAITSTLQSAIICRHTTASGSIGHRNASGDMQQKPVRTSESRCERRKAGANVEIFVDVIMRQRRHPEQGYRSCLGVIRLAKTFGHDRLDAACVRALESSPWKAAIGPGPSVRGHQSGARGGRPFLHITAFQSQKWSGSQSSHPRHALSAACVRMRLPGNR